MQSRVRLTESATRPLPRRLLLAICIIYAAFGLFGRDPWKVEDASGFGIMWTAAQGHLHDWLLPNLVGKFIPQQGPLSYILGAFSIHLFSPFIDASNASRVYTGVMFCIASIFVWYSAYLLGRRPEVQPFKYAFGGEPSAKDYGRTLADGALLILLACFGLAERGHETTPQVAQFAWLAILIYGLIRALDKPKQGAAYWGIAMGLIALSSNPILIFTLLIASLFALQLNAFSIQRFSFLKIGLPLALIIASIWPISALILYPVESKWFFHEWFTINLKNFGGPSFFTLRYLVKNLLLYTWPAWPLALWAIHSWIKNKLKPQITITTSIIVCLLLYNLLQSKQNNIYYILLLPPLAILASFALPTLKRGAINAMDWFSVLSFTILGSFVWFTWLASMTGFPKALAKNLMRQVPGYVPDFNIIALLCAIAVTVAWCLLVRWRIAKRPHVLWRSVVLSSAGTTLMWVLLMTLWLPFVNYSRTYRDVAIQIKQQLPTQYDCISPIRLGNAQLASFAYFGNLHFSFESSCSLILRQNSENYALPNGQNQQWKLIWKGSRSADKKEVFDLYQHIQK